MFRTLLVANRGEIACRIVRTARRLGIRTVAVWSDADAGALHTRMADAAVRIGPASARASYLDIEAILHAARASGAEAVHPGYGFLAQSAEFAEACAAAGLVFVGPSAAAMRAMGVKDEAKALMQKAGVPVVPGYLGESQDEARLGAEAQRIGYPLLIKAVAGGGGKGMRIVAEQAAFPAALAAARGEAERAFGNDRVMLERYVQDARHVEVQVIADRHGNTLQLLERDCSLQRRYQKIIEEAPAPRLSDRLRARLHAAAVAAARAVAYENAGTVEFVVGGAEFYFLEMNTRLQVEHAVTEALLGIDLVEWQLRVAAGEALPLAQEDVRPSGHAFEARIYAEDPRQGFLPSSGRLRELHWPEGARVDTGVEQGDRVVIDYDALLAKLIVHRADRASALAALGAALRRCRIDGVRTNLPALIALADDPQVAAGRVSTQLIDRRGAGLLPPPEHQAARAMTIAAAVLLHDPSPRSRSPWAAKDSWHIAGASGVTRLRLQSIGHPPVTIVAQPVAGGWDMTLETLPLARGDCAPVARRECRVRHMRLARDTAQATLDGVTTEAAVRVLDARIEVWLDGEWHRFARVASGEGRLATTVDTVLRAPMPGSVLAVHARAGQRVRRGEGLAVLEAMKMEHTLAASHDGVVTRVEVTAGQRLREGDLVLEIHSEPGSS